MGVLEVRELRKSYGQIAAIDGLSFLVDRGEFFTLLGPSGCGKTTTLMTLVGFEHPDSGRIILDGKDITTLPPEARGMGVVFQSYALFPHMTVIDNVLFPLKMRKMGRAEMMDRARSALVQVELQGRESELPTRLSGGQRQRVALARALVFDPAVLLMDEPLAALDRRLRQSMQFELRALQAKLGTTVIYVTHDQEEALVLSDRIGVMQSGRFEQIGPPSELYNDPVNSFVANFLGESNRLAVRIIENNGDSTTVSPLTDPNARITAPVGAIPPDGQATLLVRPECIAISTNGRVFGNVTMPGEIVDVAFVGDHLRVEVELFASERWMVRVNPAELARQHQVLQVGSTVTVCWDRDAARLIPS